jgi:hypothetical protein
MNAKQIALIGAAALAAALALRFMPQKAAVKSGAELSADTAAPDARGAHRPQRIAPDVTDDRAVAPGGAAAAPEQTRAAAALRGGPTETPPGGAAAAERREQKLEQWDALVDRIAAADDVTLELGRELQSALSGVDPQDRLPAIHSALNLVPDGGFAVFVPLLFDKSQPEEILDALFNDMLNRDDSVKVPLMKELRKDTSHPMFFESARILDATGVE